MLFLSIIVFCFYRINGIAILALRGRVHLQKFGSECQYARSIAAWLDSGDAKYLFLIT